MKKILIILIVVVCLLALSAEVFGDTFSIAGNSGLFSKSVKLEWYINNYWAAYADYFDRFEENSSFTTTIVGMEYFFNHSNNNMGFYVGAGLPLFKNLSIDSSTDQLGRDRLKEVNDLDYELRAGYRFKLGPEASYLPWFDLGQNNYKTFYFDLGFSF